MQRDWNPVPALILAICAGAFVWYTGSRMPELVASHFRASGAANGYMPRTVYLLVMLTFVVLLPLVLAIVSGRGLKNPKARLNVPNREYWLVPERRAEAVALVRLYTARLGAMLTVFLCYVHWLVVRANATQPPVLSSPWLIAGLAVFGVAMLLWAKGFLGSFLNVPGAAGNPRRRR
jgi:uncharacterized membrane protein